ncbi:mechanosensitive ion channel family protein [Polluticoccus soli]|uniref:mechanosensitive ion channel family protein n=1 Tax=Polluticoccus soli TaxID=3034150 RepID=UPI0023E27B3B|nr:mechanosensitive ion channel family protein [Flavipsychrobacter sp. JY13-12]
MIGILLQISWKELETPLAGEKLHNLAWCLGIIIVTLLIKKPLANVLTRLISGLANRFTDRNHSEKFRSLVQSPIESLLQTILFYIAFNQLEVLLDQFLLHRYKGAKGGLAIRLGDVIDHVFMLLAIIFTTLILSRIADFIYQVQHEKAIADENNEREQLLPLLKEIVKLVLWSLGIFWLLGSVFHVNVPALITGLGIGGVAIALAAKESIENLFAAFTILTDKPFQTGDTIRLGSLEGSVERIGFRSTGLRNADGSLYIIPNKKLVNENVENLSNRTSRRVRIIVNIKYGIAHTAFRQMVSELKDMVQGSLHVVHPIEISIDNFGENVMQLTLSYHLPDPMRDGVSISSVKQEINLRTYEIISKYTDSSNVSIDTSGAENKLADENSEKSDDDDIV